VVGKQLQHASPWALFVMAAAVQYDARPERPHYPTADLRGEALEGGGGHAPPHAEAEHRHGVFCAHDLPRGAVVCEVSGVGRQVCVCVRCPLHLPVHSLLTLTPCDATPRESKLDVMISPHLSQTGGELMERGAH